MAIWSLAREEFADNRFQLLFIYIEEAARLQRASTAMAPRNETKYARWHSYDGASTITLCEPCTEVRVLSP